MSFHTPSEHTIDGIPAEAELHLVHRHIGTEGRLAVVSVMIREGRTNSAIEGLLEIVPVTEGVPEKFGGIKLMLLRCCPKTGLPIAA